MNGEFWEKKSTWFVDAFVGQVYIQAYISL